MTDDQGQAVLNLMARISSLESEASRLNLLVSEQNKEIATQADALACAESENAALKIDNKELQLNFNALVREARLSENRGAMEALEKIVVFLWRNNGESDPTHVITVEDKLYIRWCAVFDELGQLKSSYQPPQPKGER